MISDDALEIVDSSLEELYFPLKALKCIQVGLLFLCQVVKQQFLLLNNHHKCYINKILKEKGLII
jgi:hypothetical protein